MLAQVSSDTHGEHAHCISMPSWETGWQELVQKHACNATVCLQITTHWPAQNVAVFPKLGPGYYSIAKDDTAAQEAYMKRLEKFKVSGPDCWS